MKKVAIQSPIMKTASFENTFLILIRITGVGDSPTSPGGCNVGTEHFSPGSLYYCRFPLPGSWQSRVWLAGSSRLATATPTTHKHTLNI